MVHIPERDASGRIYQRIAIAKAGNFLSCHVFGFETSLLGSLRSREWDNSSNCSEYSIKFYKAGFAECSDQADADLNCICTEIIFDSDKNPELMEAEVRQQIVPPYRTIFINSVAAPDIPYAMGGQKAFCRGGYDLSFLGALEPYKIDGRAPKTFVYDPVYFSHRLGIRLHHTAGLKHKLQIRLGYYRG